MAAPAFRNIPYMGVIHVVAEAAKLGFRNGHPEWCNLGQGQPEVGAIAGAPPRVDSVAFQPGDHAYGPVNGADELRDLVAAHYNRLFRQGAQSQYGRENVAIVAGGRLGLSRVFASLSGVNVGYQAPDYTAYEEMLDYHRHRFTPVLLPVTEEEGFRLSPQAFETAVRRQGLGAYVVSNPCNPTGEVLRDRELEQYVDVARRTSCLLILDEFYSHFIYEPDGSPGRGPVSSAAFVRDVNEDPVLIVDGLTKNFRYPGWRVGWIVGPAELVETIGRAASAIDGGPPMPMQRAALEVLAPQRADQEGDAVRSVFAEKRGIMRDALSAMGVRFPGRCEGTFYLWGCISDLPPPFNDAETFFRRALDARVMVVPGSYFDVNPGKARPAPSPYAQWLRFSFGPPKDNVILGLDRLGSMVGQAR